MSLQSLLPRTLAVILYNMNACLRLSVKSKDVENDVSICHRVPFFCDCVYLKYPYISYQPLIVLRKQRMIYSSCEVHFFLDIEEIYPFRIACLKILSAL